MDSFPDLTTEANCREMLDRYPDNLFVMERLASLLRSQGRHREASEILPEEPSDLKYHEQLLKDDERIRRHPNDSVAYLNRGIWHHWYGLYDKALSDFDTSIMIDPNNAYAHCARASLQATCLDESIRDGLKALENARRALELAQETGQLIGDWRHRQYLQVLAAAHAENNQFEDAIAAQSQALELAITNGPKSEIGERLEQYRRGIPMREQGGLIRSGFSR
jgi:tetratricopeptide (TPR) repeat protein